MVRLLITLFVCIALQACYAARSNLRDESFVVFEEHQINELELKRIDRNIQWYKDTFGDTLFNEDGVYLIYDSRCDACLSVEYLFFIDAKSDYIKAYYIEGYPEKNKKVYKEWYASDSVVNRIASLKYQYMPVTSGKLKDRSHELQSSRLYVIKKEDNQIQKNLFFNLRTCLKNKCLKGDETEVPSKYEDNVFLFDAILYFLSSIPLSTPTARVH